MTPDTPLYACSIFASLIRDVLKHTLQGSQLDMPRPDYRNLRPDACAIIVRQLSAHCASKLAASKLCYTVLSFMDFDANAVIQLPDGMDFRRALMQASCRCVLCSDLTWCEVKGSCAGRCPSMAVWPLAKTLALLTCRECVTMWQVMPAPTSNSSSASCRRQERRCTDG